MDADALRRLAGRTGFDVSALEKDYALTWLIQGIYAGPPLADVLIFKGGTAIRKIYAPEWRLSEDLDFTIVKSVKSTTVRKGFEKIFARLSDQSGLKLEFVQFHSKPYYIQARIQFLGPLRHKNTIKLDISLTEKLVEPPANVTVKPAYDDVPSFTALVYTSNEILVEKLRSIMCRVTR
ncbi:MAG: nucleotidyl transferase AbiEii/AbiGii toxin family protein [Euryarchaeota archaeon]|nr:nucleotidyl transferase AbiEii/AbiGii toxin family protein [Euryarchaeota archaeon]